MNYTRTYYLRKIKEKLNEDDILLNLRNKKRYLFSDYEQKILNIYLKYRYDTKVKEEFIKFFIARLKDMDEEHFEYYLNELNEICCFDIQIKLKNGTVKNIDLNMPTKTTKINSKPKSYSKDAYFTYLLEHEDYENLFKYYDIEYIKTHSNFYDKW